MDSEVIILNFMETSGAEYDIAKRFVEAGGGNLQNALNLFFQDPNMFSQSAPQINPAANFSNGMGQIPQSGPMGFQNQMQPQMGQPVRAPMAAHFDTLAGPRRGGRQAAPEPFRDYAQEWTRGTARSDNRGLADLFAPPSYIFQGTLDQACEESTKTGKWLLVNIQSTEEFSSHMLNRDVWKNPSIADIVKNHFVFAQRDQNSAFAKNFANLYKIWTHPSITIVDPVTRALRRKIVVPDQPDANNMLAPLVHFIEKSGLPSADGSHLQSSVKSGDKPKPSPKPKVSAPAKLNNDDDELAKAIAMSLAEAEESSVSDVKKAPSNFHPKPSAEPPAGPEATRILVRCPKNPRFKRRFLKTAKLKEIYAVLEHEVDVSYGNLENFVLFDARKKQTFNALERTLEELGLLNLALELKTL